MKAIHHTCRCTGQQFTFKEWVAWLDTYGRTGENSGSFVVLSHNGFNFNIHDVCITPNISVRLSNNYCCVEVKTAQSPSGRWDYGLNVNLHTSGRNSGAGFIGESDKGYPTETAAILAALLDVLDSAERQLADCTIHTRQSAEDDEYGRYGNSIKDSALAPYIRNIIKQINDKRRELTYNQLTLF